MSEKKNEKCKSVLPAKSSKIKGQNTHRFITLAIFITVAIIAMCNTLCILAVSFPESFGLQLSEALTSEEKIETAILSDCVSLIGLAIAVWTGLNIANSIERREVDRLQHRVYELGEEINKNTSEIERRNIQLNLVDKNRFLHELETLSKDKATQYLNQLFNKNSNIVDIPYLKFLEIEQIFKSVYYMHDSRYSRNDDLISAAEQGIKLAKIVMPNISDATALLYLSFRIAEFHFYMGYCYKGQACADQFLEAIDIYYECAESFNVDIPLYDSNEVYPNIKYRRCEKILDISAYFCNTIGEAYSKIVHNNQGEIDNKCSDDKIEEYGAKAVFYCAYATNWESRAVYRRNFGCALERHYGQKAFEEISLYKTLCSEYRTVIKMEPKVISNYKNIVSAYDKHVNNILGIASVKLPDHRIPTLDSAEFAEKWKNTVRKKDVELTLDSIKRWADIIKTLFPNDGIGYQYACIYFRDMCVIFGNHRLETDKSVISQMKQKAKHYWEQAEKNWKILNIVSPYDKENPMTQILRDDLDDLKNLL